MKLALNQDMFSTEGQMTVKCNICSEELSDSLSTLSQHALEHQLSEKESQMVIEESKSPINALVSLVDNSEYLKFKGTKVKCFPCHKEFSSDKKWNVEKHLKSSAHSSQIVLYNKRIQIEQSITNQQFNQWLALAFSSSDIPFRKVCGLMDFLSIFTGRHIPNEITLRRSLNSVFHLVKAQVRKCLDGKWLWMSIDEATNSLQNSKFAAVIVGTLMPNEPTSQQVFVWDYAEVTGKWDTAAVVALFQNVLNELFGENYQQRANQFVKIFVTDGGTQMTAAAKVVKSELPSLITFTCVLHGLHNLSGSILALYPDATAFVAALNNALFSSPSKLEYLRSLPGYKKTPIKMIASRWGTGLRALKYWYDNISLAILFLQKFPHSEGSYINQAKKLLTAKMQIELKEVVTRYDFLPDVIAKLETRNLEMKVSIQLIDFVADKLLQFKGETKGDKLIVRFNSILEKNREFKSFKDKIQKEEYEFLKFAPAGSFETERSIKHFKKVLAYDRSRLKHETTKELSFIKHNSVSLKMRAMPTTSKEEKEANKYLAVRPSFSSLFGLKQEYKITVENEEEVWSTEVQEDDDDDVEDAFFEEINTSSIVECTDE